ncbi:MAG: sulfide/dihydroorotate dehydrogenase-like FAD/NAD-binding protein [Candidatus Omnitrophota bacterium]
MVKIISKKVLNEHENVRITRMEVLSPAIADKARPGQFVVVMADEKGERIPLTVVDKDEKKGSIVLIFQEVGLTTKLLGRLEEGGFLYSLAGPLGHPTEIKNYGKVVLVGGGVGIAEIYPVAKALKQSGCYVTIILGAKIKELLILREELEKMADEFFAATDDGSCGKKGFTTDVLTDLLQKEKPDLVYAVGPVVMMKKIALMTKYFDIKTIVSLNSLMVDATGMCGCCRVTVGGEVKFSCVDGPEFDAHLIDWDEVDARSKIYAKAEKHICNLYKL